MIQAQGLTHYYGPYPAIQDVSFGVRKGEILGFLGPNGAGKTTTLFTQLELAKPKNVIVVESDLRESAQIEGLLDDAADGGVIVFDDLQDNADTFVNLEYVPLPVEGSMASRCLTRYPVLRS